MRKSVEMSVQILSGTGFANKFCLTWEILAVSREDVNIFETLTKNVLQSNAFVQEGEPNHGYNDTSFHIAC